MRRPNESAVLRGLPEWGLELRPNGDVTLGPRPLRALQTSERVSERPFGSASEQAPVLASLLPSGRASGPRPAGRASGPLGHRLASCPASRRTEPRGPEVLALQARQPP